LLNIFLLPAFIYRGDFIGVALLNSCISWQLWFSNLSTLPPFDKFFNLYIQLTFFFVLALVNSLPSPPQPAGCVAGTPLLLLLSKNMLRIFRIPASRNRTKRGVLSSYCFQLEVQLERPCAPVRFIFIL
jgi:hypothetical protein